MFLRIINITLFSFLLTIFVPQGTQASASATPRAQRVENLVALQKEFGDFQRAILAAHGHLVKLKDYQEDSKFMNASPIDTLTINNLDNIIQPPAYLGNSGHAEDPETHIKKWIDQADLSIHQLRVFSGASFTTGGLLDKYKALKTKMLKALEG